MLTEIDKTRLHISAEIEAKKKSQFGQFLTPATTAQFMASLFAESTFPVCRLLDPGAGIGSLASAFLERWVAGGFGFRSVELTAGQKIHLSPGEHSELIKAVIVDFASRFDPGGVLIYAGDTGDKWGYFDAMSLADLGVNVEVHGKMPDVVIHHPERNWLLLVESVTSHGPVDGKRHAELARLFATSKAGLVYVTAFPDRSLMSRYLGEIAWETEVWVADAPSHLIHFNGARFLGPHASAP